MSPLTGKPLREHHHSGVLLLQVRPPGDGDGGVDPGDGDTGDREHCHIACLIKLLQQVTWKLSDCW